MKIRSLLLLSILLITFSCKNKDNKEQEDSIEMTRKEFMAEANPVDVMVLTKKNFNKELVSNGRLSAKRKSVIGFRTGGIIENINVDNGDYVNAGTILATLNTDELNNELLSRKQSLEMSRINLYDAIIGYGYDPADTSAIPADILNTAKIRSGYNASVLNLESTQMNFEKSTLKAPFSGKVANIRKKTHETGTDDFCSIIDDSRMNVEFPVLETELDFVSKGQNIRVVSFSNPDISVNGVITSINPIVDNNGQVLVKAEIVNRNKFIDGMNVKVYVESSVKDQLVVPKSAVVIRDNLEVLFTYSEGRAKWTYIHTLMSNSHEYVIAPNESRGAELQVGDSIIISGNLNLAHDSAVQLKTDN